jgi:hypothetical protein
MKMMCRLIHHLVVEMEYEYFVANSSVRDILRVFAGLCGPVLPVVCDIFMFLNSSHFTCILLNSSHFTEFSGSSHFTCIFTEFFCSHDWGPNSSFPAC